MRKSLKIGLLVVLAILCLGFIIKEAMGNGDFKIFLEAAKVLRVRGDIYNIWFDRGDGAAGLYYYSPFFAMLLVPFSYLPQFVPHLIWLLLNVLFLYRIWKLISEYFDFQDFNNKNIKLLLLLTLLLTVRFIHINFGMIQMTIYLLWSILESIQSIKNKKLIKGSVILALAINIKILPLVLIPYLIYRNHLKAVMYTTGFFLIFLWLPLIFIGLEYNNLLLYEWWQQVNPLHNNQLFESARGIHSLTALIPSLLHDTGGVNDPQRHIVDMDLKYVAIILNSIRIALVLFTVYFLRTLPFKPAKSKIYEIWELSYIILLIPLIFPHQQKYAFFLVLPAVAYILYFLIFLHKFDQKEFIKRKWKVMIVILVISFVLTTLTSDFVVGRPLNILSQHYKTITYGTILLLIVLANCNPKYLSGKMNISEQNSSLL